MDLFFVLSGYLITTLLLREFDGSTTVALGQFWLRRLRRLGPALVVVLIIAALFGTFIASGDQVDRIRGDILGSAFYIANWRFISSTQGYWEQFTAPSPLQHMWSLAIEEQFYLVWPPLLLVGLRATRRLSSRTWRWVLVAMAGVGIIASVLYMAALYNADPASSNAYYNTFARAQTLLVGVMVAILLHRRDQLNERVERAIGASAVLGLVGSLVLFSLAQGTASWMYHGGFLLAALTAALVVAGASRLAPGLVTEVLSIRPLPQIGLISYGLYVYHWPIYLVLDEDRTGLNGPLLLAIRLLATVAVSVLSYQFLERPIRERAFGGSGPVAVAGVGAAVLALALVLMPAANSNADLGYSRELADRVVGNELQGASASSKPLSPGAIKVGTFGDSMAMALAVGLGGTDSRIVTVGGYARPGCTIGRGGDKRGGSIRGDVATAPIDRTSADCDWTDRWPNAVRGAGGLDVALVLVGHWDVGGRRIPELGDQWRTAGDPVYDKWLASEIGAAADALQNAGGRSLVWLTLPPNADQPNNDRVDRFNELVRQLAVTRPWMRVVDFAAYLDQSGQDQQLRPDDVHLTNEGGLQI